MWLSRRSWSLGWPAGWVWGLQYWLLFGLVDRLVVGLLYGIIAGLALGLVIMWEDGLDRIVPVEALRWSWREARDQWVSMLVLGMLIGLALAFVNPPDTELIDALFGVLIAGLVIALMGGLTLGLSGGLTTDQVVTRAIPNEGIRRSLRNALISFLCGELPAGLMIFGIVGLEGGLLEGLVVGLLYRLMPGLFFGLKFGGLACIGHYVLRMYLWRNGYAPLNYVRFLDYAAERVFLRKVGGGYIFTHRLLMEYFASLTPRPLSTESRPAAAPTHRS